MTHIASVWPVGFLSSLFYEGPICKNGRVQSWRTKFAPGREFPTDMAGFAINLCLFLKHPHVLLSSTAQIGAIETNILEYFVTRKDVECRGSDKEVYRTSDSRAHPRLLSLAGTRLAQEVLPFKDRAPQHTKTISSVAAAVFMTVVLSVPTCVLYYCPVYS